MDRAEERQLKLRRALTAKGTLIPIGRESSGRWIGPLGRTVKALVAYLHVPDAGSE